jgi:hypothetical protein
MSKITIEKLIENGAAGLSVRLMPKDSHHAGKFEGRVYRASGNGDVVSYDADPNAALQAAKELHMEFERRKADRPAPSPPKAARARRGAADDGMELV